MKLFFQTFLFFFISSQLFAQNSVVDIKDPQAEKILNAISSKLESYKSVEMDFDFEMEWPGMEPEIQSGKIIQQGDKYFVEMKMQSVYCDGNSLWIYMKNNKEVQWNNAEEAEEGGFMNPSALINLYKTGDFAYAITEEVKEDSKWVQKIEFKPLDNTYQYSKMRLTIIKGENQVKNMKVFSKDGSNYTMNINKIESNKTYDDATFIFDKTKFPGVHVEDLRID